MLKRLFTTLTIALFIFVLMLPASQPADAVGLADTDWPCYKGNAQRTGLSQNDFSANQGQQNWVVNIGGSICASPIIGTDGNIYAMSSYGFTALDLEGNEIWAKDWIGSDRSYAALGDDGTIYHQQTDDVFTAMDQDGNIIWSYPMIDEISASPVIGNDGTIYFGTHDYKLWNEARTSYEWTSSFLALNPDGSVKWNHTFEYSIVSSPTLSLGNTIYVTHSRNISALNQNGNEIWRTYLNEYVGICTPAVAPDGSVYHVTNEGNITHLSSSGMILDTNELPEYVTGEISIGPDGNVYIGASDGILYSFTPSLSPRWTFTTDYIINAPPTITNDNVILVGSQDGYLYAIDSDGSEIWNFDTGNPIIASPIITSDGTIYIGVTGGNLYSIGDGSEFVDPVDHEEPLTGFLPCCNLLSIPLIALGVVFVSVKGQKKP